jgi:hypothetical protein
MRQATVEEWLREKEREAEGITFAILKWAKIAGWAGIIGIVVGTIAILVTLWTAGKI